MICLEEIVSDIQWRLGELASIKTVPLRYHLLSRHKEMLIKYSVVSIYAIWEGFVRNSFHSYIRYLNDESIPCDKVEINLLTHTFTTDDKLALENARMTFQSKKIFVNHFISKTAAPLTIDFKLPTKSNINFEVVNDILERFNLVSLDTKYESDLKKLLTFRNDIAHGQDSIPVKIEDVESFTQLVENLMGEIYECIENGIQHKSYLKD